MTFTEQQMNDPWAWCLGVIAANNWTSKQVAEAIEAPWSTVRALLNGTNPAPRYELLQDIVTLCIEGMPEEVSEHEFL